MYRCDRCGVVAVISVEAPTSDGGQRRPVWRLRRMQVRRLIGRCRCGGSFDADAPVRCRDCGSTDVDLNGNPNGSVVVVD